MRRSKPPRRKTPKRKLYQKADLLMRDNRILPRDGFKCVRCPSTHGLAAAHVYPKGKYQRLRFMEINLLSLCYGCHIHWWHKSPIEATEWFLKTYPERAAQLQILKDTAPKVDVEALIEELSR